MASLCRAAEFELPRGRDAPVRTESPALPQTKEPELCRPPSAYSRALTVLFRSLP